jgi:hypothetical protein
LQRTLHGVEADRYEIRVRGLMGDAVLKRFEEFEVEIAPVETVLRGEIRDQSELHGLLSRIESLGLELVEIKQVAGRTRRVAPGTT